MKQKMTFFTFISAFRIVYAIPFLLASLTGLVRAYFATQEILILLLILWEVFWLAMLVNLSNDYFDFLSGADRERFTMDEEKKTYIYQNVLSSKVYWQGNLFDLGYLSKKQGQLLLAGIVMILLVSAYPLFLAKGLIVVILGIVGLIIAFFYTAPPLNLGANGLGEVSVLLSFFLISYFSAYIVMGFHSGEMFIFSMMVGITGFLMRLADEMTGYEAHLQSKERDLSIRFGIPMTIQFISVIMAVMYTLYLLAAIFFQQWKMAIPLLTIPIALKIIYLYQSQEDEYRIIRAVPEMLKLSTGNSILIVITWLVIFFC